MNYKFIGLYKFFETLKDKKITLSFEKIEKLVGEPLCFSARNHKPYWHPSKTHTITRSWVENGYKMVDVDLLSERITFEKEW
jgi:hypothetical protein